MSLKRLTLPFACLLLVLGSAGTALAAVKSYSLAGNSGGQLQIGGGLPLPIQLTSPTATGTMFPTLLIPPVPGATVMGTTTNASNQQLTVPATVLSRPAVQVTVGVFGQNPNLYAVATNLGYKWPSAAVTLNTTKRTGAPTTTFTPPLGNGNNITYVAPGTGKFGGPARFAISQNLGQGVMPAVAVTIYAIAVKPAGNPPCTHTALTPVPFPPVFPSPACVAALGQAVPNALAAAGGPISVLATTPGGTPAATAAGGPIPGIGIGKFGAAPTGTVSFFVFTPNGTMMGFTNMATSYGYPFTVGQLVISAPLAAGAPEIFTITGMDSRTAGGQGSLQLVSGSLSARTASGPNANRGWVRLNLSNVPAVPSFTDWGLMALSGSLLAMAAFVAVRRSRRAEVA